MACMSACLLLAVVALAAVGAATEGASAQAEHAEASELKQSVLDLVECSHEFAAGVQVNGSSIQEGGWVPPKLHSKGGDIIQCGGSVNAEDHSLIVVFNRKGNGQFIVEVLPSSETDERQGLDHGVCDRTRMFDVERSLLTVPFEEGSTLKLRALYTRNQRNPDIYLTHDCEYTVIASKEKLQKLEKERQRLLEQMHLEEAAQREVEMTQQEAKEEALEEALLEEEASLE